jgi:fatty acid desaturase
MRKRRPAWFRQLMLETVLFFLVMAGLAVLDWQKWLLYVVIPYQYAAWGIVSINYAQHDGCDPESPYNHSRSFVGRLVNWWTFNNGYHGMHHMRPGLHWSKLPEAHRRELSPHIHPNLEQRSFLGYLVRTHIWPGKRVDYRGEPLKLPDAGPDEEWLTRRFMDRPGVSLGAESGDDGQKLGVLPSS